MRKRNKKNTVFVGLSGGVDSSVSAYLLKKRGYEVVGVFIRSYNLDGCAQKDAEDARRVAEQLNIPFYVFDFEKEYKKAVVDYMIEHYKMGLTPNPDMLCNRFIKFWLFLEKAKEAGADFIATGHYAFLRRYKDNIHLYAGRDENKDQSYFLGQVKKEALRYAIFPLGKLKKEEVRTIARKENLVTAFKKDSQGICFLGKVSIFEFLRKFLPLNPGKIVTTKGEEIGIHNGLFFYTIGQRHLGVNIKPHRTNHKPFYVAYKDYKNNVLIVAEGSDNPALFKEEIGLGGINLLSDLNELKSLRVLMRVRYRQPLFEAKLTDIDIKNRRAKAVFLKPQKFVAPGQFAVFYSKKREVLGSGTILPFDFYFRKD